MAETIESKCFRSGCNEKSFNLYCQVHASLANAPGSKVRILEYIKQIQQLETALKRAQVFYNDIMPQIGGIGLQDYANMNELGMALNELLPSSDSKRFSED